MNSLKDYCFGSFNDPRYHKGLHMFTEEEPYNRFSGISTLLPRTGSSSEIKVYLFI